MGLVRVKIGVVGTVKIRMAGKGKNGGGLYG